MISVVIPTLNAEGGLAGTLAALFEAALDGHVKEVIVSDAGSTDATRTIADTAGARVIVGEKGRGGQLARGAAEARGRWLLFLHADTALEASWAQEARAFMAAGEDRAAVFTLRFDAKGAAPRIVEAGAMLRTRLFKAPYGDQGMLIARSLYDALGGYLPMPLFEDVDLATRLVRAKGRGALNVFSARAVTSPARYEKDGYMRRVLKNAWCLALYRAGVAPAKIADFYAR